MKPLPEADAMLCHPLGSPLEARRRRAAALGSGGLGALLDEVLGGGLLEPQAEGVFSRRRVFDGATTFAAFLWQALNAQASCRQAVLQVQAQRAAAGLVLPLNATSAFCQARADLPAGRLGQIAQALAERVRQALPPGANERALKLIDGTGLQAEDTPSNREKWGYAGGQKEGCGTPALGLAALFCAQSGAWLGHHHGSGKAHDLALSLPLIKAHVAKGDILLGDRAFCAWWLLALLKEKGADALFRLHQCRPADFEDGTPLGEGDRLCVWPRPQRPPTCPLSAEAWAALPRLLHVRVVRVRVEAKGQRTREVHLATTLLDPKAHAPAELGALYARRWQAELCLDDLKTSLGMGFLRCKSPQMVERALWVYASAYNLVRLMMAKAAGKDALRLSFKGSADAIVAWTGALPIAGALGRPASLAWWARLLSIIAQDVIPLRPHRHEPRSVKRRPKTYQLMTRPRPQMRETAHRGKRQHKVGQAA